MSILSFPDTPEEQMVEMIERWHWRALTRLAQEQDRPQFDAVLLAHGISSERRDAMWERARARLGFRYEDDGP